MIVEGVSSIGVIYSLSARPSALRPSDTDFLGGPGLYSWMEIRESESELREFYDKCRYKFGWTHWQRFKMWLFRKRPKVIGYKEVYCNELDNV